MAKGGKNGSIPSLTYALSMSTPTLRVEELPCDTIVHDLNRWASRPRGVDGERQTQGGYILFSTAVKATEAIAHLQGNPKISAFGYCALAVVQVPRFLRPDGWWALLLRRWGGGGPPGVRANGCRLGHMPML